jgi:hypothetical protein
MAKLNVTSQVRKSTFITYITVFKILESRNNVVTKTVHHKNFPTHNNLIFKKQKPHFGKLFSVFDGQLKSTLIGNAVIGHRAFVVNEKEFSEQQNLKKLKLIIFYVMDIIFTLLSSIDLT